ncbi:LuxR C-terminal-related transcriptional regulator [Streptomyces griseorubiginosus]|uniref:LuxR C-terminal-related transcriptional regulator n=1 Tax=Streptomyces griseorubiginosus TaxID=67304 RepID=UPI002E81322D|nr:LuxR C-terminal-related transcriptional regulator [Streptomyces griseorubiginosus]WUB45443.1 LuxR C-terminal-related transcriptional regulator [Streptomyces griseorubiginosus]WUB53961.1 LuxR C-terminal-related transcriptional regulator [Streptomyces griseorubiginosus]
MLELLGLGKNSAELYRAVLAQPGLSVEDLMNTLRWPADRVRSALDECVRLSLIRPSWETPGTLRAVPPDVGLQALLARQEADFLERQRQMTDARVEVSRLVHDYAAAQRESHHIETERIEGIDEIRSRIEELSHSCQDSLLAFHPGGGQSAASRAAGRPLSETLQSRGVVMHTIYLDSLYNDPESVDYARWLLRSGNHVRTTASLPSRMLIFDREQAVVPIDPDDSGAGAMVFRSPGILANLCALFDHVWDKAVPLSGRKRPRQPAEENELTSQEQTVLRLLGEGLTDEVVARRLGVSVRTGRRITADLMGRLGAKSRFQAGMRAVESGWLGGDDDGDAALDGAAHEPGEPLDDLPDDTSADASELRGSSV